MDASMFSLKKSFAKLTGGEKKNAAEKEKFCHSA